MIVFVFVFYEIWGLLYPFSPYFLITFKINHFNSHHSNIDQKAGQNRFEEWQRENKRQVDYNEEANALLNKLQRLDDAIDDDDDDGDSGDAGDSSEDESTGEKAKHDEEEKSSEKKLKQGIY
jgi:hypothetical protein